MADSFCGTTEAAPETTSALTITGRVQEGPWGEAPSQEHRDVQEYFARLGFVYGVGSGGCFCVQDETKEGAPVVAAVVCDPPAKSKWRSESSGAVPEQPSPPSLVQEDKSINTRLYAFGKFVTDFHAKNVQGRPHWNVQMIGVSPSRQGKGYGCFLLRHLHSLADEDGVDAYLETVGDRNRAVFEKAGYQVTDTAVMSLDTATDDVTMIAMVRRHCGGGEAAAE